MDYIHKFYHKFENWYFRRQYLMQCQFKCIQLQSMYTRHFKNCWEGCKLYVDGKENNFDQKCEKYLEFPHFFNHQKTVLRAQPQKTFNACIKGMKAMEQQYKRAEIQNNGRATLLKSWQKFYEDPMKVILTQEAYKKPVQKQQQKAIIEDLWQ